MFLECSFPSTSEQTGWGLRELAYTLDYALTNTAASKTTAQATGTTITELSTSSPGNWVRRQTLGDFNPSAQGATYGGVAWAWSQPVTGKPDQAFYHKGFGLAFNHRGQLGNTNPPNNYYQGYMGAFQNAADKNAFATFDSFRPLNWPYTTAATETVSHATLSGDRRFVYQDKYIIAAAQGYMFIGNLTMGNFWAVVDATVLPTHQYASSNAIPMLGFSGLGQNITTGNTRNELTVLVHKYDSGNEATYNALLSTTQTISSDSATTIVNQNFLSMYPYSGNSLSAYANKFDVDGKRSTTVYPIIIGNPIKGNSFQSAAGLVLLGGQNHETGQTFYVGNTRYYKFVCTHDINKSTATATLTLGIPIK